MQTKHFHIYCNEYHWDELPEDFKDLLNQSSEAQAKAYAPYSNFKVGTAILLEDGTVFTGSNQENVAFPSGLCAERVAIFACKAQYPDLKIKMIAITAGSEEFDIKTTLAPCGACRQAMLEYEVIQEESIKLLLKGVDNQVIEFLSVADLLPLPFKCDALQNVSGVNN